MLLSRLEYLGWGRCGLQGEGSSGVGVGEGAGILILKSLRGVLALGGLPAGDGLAVLDGVSLAQGPVRGDQIPCVQLGFKDADAPPILECFGDSLGGPDVDSFLYSGPAGNDIVLSEGRLLFSRPLGLSLDGLGRPWTLVRLDPLSLRAALDGSGL